MSSRLAPAMRAIDTARARIAACAGVGTLTAPAIRCGGSVYLRCPICSRLHAHGAAGGNGLRLAHCTPRSLGSYEVLVILTIDPGYQRELDEVWRADGREVWRALRNVVRRGRRRAA